MSLPNPPDITEGQIALDPVNGIVYYKKDGQLIATTWSWLQDDLNAISTEDNVLIDSDLTVAGNLVIEGDTVSLNVSQVLIEDNILILNSNFTGSPTLDAAIEIERGDQTNVSIKWNESTNAWQFTNDGINYFDLNSIVENSVTLGFHTVGDYIKTISSGTGVTIIGGSGEGATPTISIGQDVSTSATPTFGRVIAPLTGNVTGNVTGDLTGNVTGNLTGDVTGDVTGDLTGNVTGNVTGDLTGNVTGNVTGQISDISNHTITDLDDVVINSPNNGDFLRYNGSIEKWINDPVNLTTDTVGDYVAKLAAGTGITITNNSGEGSTPNISFSGSINDLSDLIITSAENGQILEYDGTAWVNTVRPSSEPIGHENKNDSVISFNESTREFSISPTSTSYTVWCVGKRYVKTTTEKITIPDTSGLYYIYFNSSGNLAYKTTFFTWDEDTPTSYVYWNDVDNKAYFFADERHGVTLDWATHEYLHRTRGAAIANGFGANNYTLVGDGSLDAHAKIDIADGTFFDEDLQVDIIHSSSPTANTWQQRLQSGAYIPVFYKSGNSWKKDVATQFPVKNGGTRAQYNLYSGGTWSTTAVDNAKYGAMFLVATNNLNEPVLAIMGQAQYTDQGSAEASTWDELDLSGFPIVEFRPLYKIVFQTATAYENTPKTKFVNLLDLRQISSIGPGGSSTAVSDHGSLTGLTDDDHPQYLLVDGSRNVETLTVTGNLVTNKFILDGIEIDAATPSDTNVLKYSSALNKYIPGVASTVASLNDLTDVVLSSATPNQILVYQENGTWINGFVPIPSVEGTAYFQTIGDGVNQSFTINHNLGTRDVFVSTRDANAPYASFITSWEAVDSNNIVLIFDNPLDSSSVRVSVYAALAGSSFPDLEGTTYVGVFGDGAASTIPVIHDLGTKNIFVQARNANSPYELFNVAWEATSNNITTFYFDSPPAQDSVQILIYSSVIGVPTTSLSGLTDVNYVNPNDNDILSWDEASLRWIPQAFVASVSDIDNISNVSTGSAVSGDYLKFNGTNWVNNAIDLGTDTNGNYVKNLVAGNGISITNNSGEGATPTVGVSNIANADISATAAISYSKLNLNNLIDYTDLKDGPAKAGFRSTINAQTGTSYTLALSDLAKLITLDNTSSITLTVPLDSSVAFAIGDRIDILQKNTGQVTIAGAVGVTVNATPGLKLRSRWSSATIVKLDTNSWVVIGDMQA